jgi:hypothetical protein
MQGPVIRRFGKGTEAGAVRAGKVWVEGGIGLAGLRESGTLTG